MRCSCFYITPACITGGMMLSPRIRLPGWRLHALGSQDMHTSIALHRAITVPLLLGQVVSVGLA